MRIFTGIPLPNEIKDKITEITRGRLPVPYVNTTNLHITLNFFGELDTDQVGKVKNIFNDVCSGKKSLEVKFSKLVAHHNRQIHITLISNQELSSLHRELEESFESNGFHFQERSY